jgi:hypothetical protein
MLVEQVSDVRIFKAQTVDLISQLQRQAEEPAACVHRSRNGTMIDFTSLLLSKTLYDNTRWVNLEKSMRKVFKLETERPVFKAAGHLASYLLCRWRLKHFRQISSKPCSNCIHFSQFNIPTRTGTT